MSITLWIACRRCGELFEADRTDLLRKQRLCPDCRTKGRKPKPRPP